MTESMQIKQCDGMGEQNSMSHAPPFRDGTTIISNNEMRAEKLGGSKDRRSQDNTMTTE